MATPFDILGSVILDAFGYPEVEIPDEIETNVIPPPKPNKPRPSQPIPEPETLPPLNRAPKGSGFHTKTFESLDEKVRQTRAQIERRKNGDWS